MHYGPSLRLLAADFCDGASLAEFGHFATRASATAPCNQLRSAAPPRTQFSSAFRSLPITTSHLGHYPLDSRTTQISRSCMPVQSAIWAINISSLNGTAVHSATNGPREDGCLVAAHTRGATKNSESLIRRPDTVRSGKLDWSDRCARRKID